jgi:YD repeat-containing protein
MALMSDQADGRVVDLVNLEPGAVGVEFRVPAPNGSTAHPSREGGVHIVDADGRIHTYDAEGTLIAEVATAVHRWRLVRGTEVEMITLDPASGRLALADREGGVLIVDPRTGEPQLLPVSDAAANLGFARNGELLAITGADGTVRLWDVERNASAGVVWTGTGAVAGSPSWYDEATDTIWVSSSGKLLQIPLDPELWLERACVAAGRNFTQEEWDRYVPGDRPMWFSCLDLVGTGANL